ncbi:membrane protein insertase YidC [Candidatus Uhrbacteria bacterium]|nr:membrane protein insertase YidC [Candidatus Uhrbacteria bacterium]
MFQLYTTIIYQPLFNLFIFFYTVIPGTDLGVAIIAVTIILKLVLLPFAHASLKSQRALQQVQPQLDAIKKQFKDDKTKQTQAMMDLYKKEKVNPFSSCLPLLIQLPFLIAIYQVFQNGIASQDLALLYPFVSNPGTLNSIAFGFLDLAKANIILAVLAAAAQFWQTKMMMQKKPEVQSAGAKDEAMLAGVNKQMMYMMPAMTLLFGITLPSGLMLFWLGTTLFTVLQQWYFLREKKTAVV